MLLVQALHAYNGANGGIAFAKGQVFWVLNHVESEPWWMAEVRGKKGWVPQSYVRVLEDEWRDLKAGECRPVAADQPGMTSAQLEQIEQLFRTIVHDTEEGVQVDIVRRNIRQLIDTIPPGGRDTTEFRILVGWLHSAVGELRSNQAALAYALEHIPTQWEFVRVRLRERLLTHRLRVSARQPVASARSHNSSSGTLPPLSAKGDGRPLSQTISMTQLGGLLAAAGNNNSISLNTSTSSIATLASAIEAQQQMAAAIAAAAAANAAQQQQQQQQAVRGGAATAAAASSTATPMSASASSGQVAISARAGSGATASSQRITPTMSEVRIEFEPADSAGRNAGASVVTPSSSPMSPSSPSHSASHGKLLAPGSRSTLDERAEAQSTSSAPLPPPSEGERTSSAAYGSGSGDTSAVDMQALGSGARRPSEASGANDAAFALLQQQLQQQQQQIAQLQAQVQAFQQQNIEVLQWRAACETIARTAVTVLQDFDGDGDGKLNHAELHAALRKIGLDLQQPELRATLDIIESDGDALVDVNEWLEVFVAFSFVDHDVFGSVMHSCTTKLFELAHTANEWRLSARQSLGELEKALQQYQEENEQRKSAENELLAAKRRTQAAESRVRASEDRQAELRAQSLRMAEGLANAQRRIDAIEEDKSRALADLSERLSAKQRAAQQEHERVVASLREQIAATQREYDAKVAQFHAVEEQIRAQARELDFKRVTLAEQLREAQAMRAEAADERNQVGHQLARHRRKVGAARERALQDLSQAHTLLQEALANVQRVETVASQITVSRSATAASPNAGRFEFTAVDGESLSSLAIASLGSPTQASLPLAHEVPGALSSIDDALVGNLQGAARRLNELEQRHRSIEQALQGLVFRERDRSPSPAKGGAGDSHANAAAHGGHLLPPQAPPPPQQQQQQQFLRPESMQQLLGVDVDARRPSHGTQQSLSAFEGDNELSFSRDDHSSQGPIASASTNGALGTSVLSDVLSPQHGAAASSLIAAAVASSSIGMLLSPPSQTGQSAQQQASGVPPAGTRSRSPDVRKSRPGKSSKQQGASTKPSRKAREAPDGEHAHTQATDQQSRQREQPAGAAAPPPPPTAHAASKQHGVAWANQLSAVHSHSSLPAARLRSTVTSGGSGGAACITVVRGLEEAAISALMDEFPLCLFATAHCPYAHQIRMLLEVKGALAAVPIVELSAEQLQDPGLGVLTKSGRRALPVLWTGKRVLPAQNCLDALDHLDAMFADVPLWPSEPDVRAHARSMIDYGIRSFVPAFFDLLRTPANAPDAALRSLRAALATWRTLDILLERFSVQYAVGTQVSMVDVFFAPFLVLYRVNEYYRDFRVPEGEDFSHVRRWRAAVLSHPALQSTRPSAALLVKLYYAVSAQPQQHQLQLQQRGGDPTAEDADESDAAAAALVAAALRDGQVEAIAASSAAEAVAGTGTVVSQLPRAMPAASGAQHAGSAAQSVADRRAEVMFSPGRSRSPSGGAMSPLGAMPPGAGAAMISGALSPVHSRPGTASAARGGVGVLVARSATPQPASRALSPPPSATRNASATPAAAPAPDRLRTPSQAQRPRAVQSPQPPERQANHRSSASAHHQHGDAGGSKPRGASRRQGAAVRAREQQ